MGKVSFPEENERKILQTNGNGTINQQSAFEIWIFPFYIGRKALLNFYNIDYRIMNFIRHTKSWTRSL